MAVVRVKADKRWFGKLMKHAYANGYKRLGNECKRARARHEYRAEFTPDEARFLIQSFPKDAILQQALRDLEVAERADAEQAERLRLIRSTWPVNTNTNTNREEH